MAEQGPHRVMDIRDVALALHCSETSVKTLVKKGFLRKPRHILTKAVWFQSDIEEYLRRLDRFEFEEDGGEDETPRKKQ